MVQMTQMSMAQCLRNQLTLTGPLEGDEPPDRSVNRAARSDDPVVLMDERLFVTQGLGHLAPDGRVEHDGAGAGITERDIVVEHRRVLADHLERLAQR